MFLGINIRLMLDIFLKLLIMIMFLSMEEIPYLFKLISIFILGAILIIDWYTVSEED